MTDQTSETTPDGLDVAAVKERVEATTEGPWESGSDGWVDTASGDGEDWCFVRPVGSTHEVTGLLWFGEEDADRQIERDHEFIAHARTDIPLLLAALDRARAEVADYERGICWDSTCLNCARAIEQGHAEYERAEAAEARAAAGDRVIEQVRALADDLLAYDWAHSPRPVGVQNHMSYGEGLNRAGLSLTAALATADADVTEGEA